MKDHGDVPLLQLADLLTLAEVNAVPHATPKSELATRLDRALDNKAARLMDQRLLRSWAFKVKDRGKWKDAKTGQHLRRCLDLDPLRAEAHHVVSRDDWNVRYDIRNGVCLSLATHILVEHNKLRIEGTAWFTIRGTKYIDATAPVYFVRT
jgi:hypothetical protein